jgi:hypothetical protein
MLRRSPSCPDRPTNTTFEAGPYRWEAPFSDELGPAVLALATMAGGTRSTTQSGVVVGRRWSDLAPEPIPARTDLDIRCLAPGSGTHDQSRRRSTTWLNEHLVRPEPCGEQISLVS